MKRIVLHAVRRLRPIRDSFDAVAFRGMSGAIIGPSVAQRLNKDIIVVRKGERRNSRNKVEGITGSRYIIIDDFISTGSTINAIRDGIYKWDESSTLVGVVLYDHDREQWTKLSNYLNNSDKVWLLCRNDEHSIFEQT